MPLVPATRVPGPPLEADAAQVVGVSAVPALPVGLPGEVDPGAARAAVDLPHGAVVEGIGLVAHPDPEGQEAPCLEEPQTEGREGPQQPLTTKGAKA